MKSSKRPQFKSNHRQGGCFTDERSLPNRSAQSALEDFNQLNPFGVSRVDPGMRNVACCPRSALKLGPL